MTQRNFRTAVVAIALFYLAIEAAYAVRAPRVMDEFVNAYVIHRLAHQLPYRDYQPPKTVLGFYLEAPVLEAVRDSWDAMTAVKIELALLNALALVAAAFVLARRLDRRAVIASLALLVVMTNFLERSAELRVDPLAALFGLVSLVCLVARRPLAAGAVCALSFLSTQKGVYFVVAGMVALAALWLRDRSGDRGRALLRFALGSAAVLALYVAFWSLVAPFRNVMTVTFFDPRLSAIALEASYDIRWRFWSQTLARNPFLYALAAAGLVVAVRRWFVADDIIAPYAATLAILAVWHKQPWPYFFVFLAPALLVLNASTLDALLARPWPRAARIAFAAAFIALGLLLPLSRIPHALARDNGFQRAMVDAGEHLLAPGETYADGISMLYRHEPVLPLFAWLDGPALLRARAVPSDTLLAALSIRPPKLLIWNARLAALPPPISRFLATQYRPVYGVLFLYAPVVAGPRFVAHFDGTYRVDGAAIIDGTSLRAGATIELRRGPHSLAAERPVRLRLLPPRDIEADPRYIDPRELFPDVYDF